MRRMRLLLCYNTFIMIGCNLCQLFIRLLPQLALIMLFWSKACPAGETEPIVNPLTRLVNPFCSVATYSRRDLPSQGLALIEAGGRAVIYLDAMQAAVHSPYRDFLMAHECCHHARGHLQRLKKKGEERALLALSFVNRSVELDADCCAAVALANAGRREAVREAARRMRLYGAKPTGEGGYPAGIMRARLIEQCAATAPSTIPPGAGTTGGTVK